MAQPVLPNPNNFLGVALVIKRSRDGPSFVFHYPPRMQPPNGPQQHAKPLGGAIEGDDVLLERLNQPTDSLDEEVDLSSRIEHLSNWDEHQFTESGTQIVPWEHVAGFPTRDLASILTPARAYHKKLFQLSLDPLYCVSYPIHVPETGTWKKKRKNKTKSEKAKSVKTEDTAIGPKLKDAELADHDGDGVATVNGSEISPQESQEKDKEREPQKDEDDDDKRASMTMFNLVFILNPRKHEVKELVNTLYFHIIKKVNKAFKYSQQHSDFVWKESKRIISMKEKAREESESLRPLTTRVQSGDSAC